MEITRRSYDLSENPVGVSNAFPFKTSFGSTKSSNESLRYSRIDPNGSNNTKFIRSKYSGISPQHTQFHFEHVPCAKKRRDLAPCLQLEKVECFPKNRQVSTYFSKPCARFFAGAGLDGKIGFNTSLQPCTYSSRSSMLPPASVPRQTVANDIFTIRSSHRAQNFCLSVKLDGRNVTREGYPYDCVFGRLSNGSPGQISTRKTSSSSPLYVSTTGVDGKFGKVCFSSSKSDRVFGINMGPLAESQIPPTQKDQSFTEHFVTSGTEETSVPSRDPEHYRPFEFLSASDSFRTFEFSSPVKILQFDTSSTNSCSPSASNRCDSGARMVVPPLSRQGQDTLFSVHELLDDRCSEGRMGGRSKRLTVKRNMGQRRRASSFQPQRDARGAEVSFRIRSFSEGNDAFVTERQHVSSSVSQKRGWIEVRNLNGFNLSDFSDSTRLQNPDYTIPYTRSLQRHSGSFVAGNSSTRVASSTRSNECSLQEVGCSRSRSFCLSDRTCCSQVCDSRSTRSRGMATQCFCNRVEVQVSLGIPSSKSDAQGSDALKSGGRHFSNSSPQVESSVLANGSQSSCDRTTVHNTPVGQGPSRHLDGQTATNHSEPEARDMEMWGWSNSLEAWSLEQKHLLRAGWRQSTLATYRPAWNRWLEWCAETGTNFRFPSGSDLAKFLADLHIKFKLSYSTILLHKSVVSTLCNVEDDKRLSSHILVKQILRSIALNNYKMRSDMNKVVWDCDILENWLKNRNIKNFNLYETSRTCAVVLLLCSGRRIHDLTLLSVSADRCQISDQYITLWPHFGSKTDSLTHRQSGWKLLSNPNIKSLDPVFLIKMLIRLGSDRRTSASTDRLFVTACGVPKAASRTTIANWVKSIFKEVGIDAAPGSVRSAVASRSWLDNESVDKIMSRANWKSSKTFQKFYKKEVRKNSGSSLKQNTLRNKFIPM